MNEFQYLVDHLPSIITAFFTGLIAWRQSGNTRRAIETNDVVKQTKHDIHNGIGEKIAEKAVERMAPALTEAASVAADKIVQKADEVATTLAKASGWNGVERRVGPVDRRK